MLRLSDDYALDVTPMNIVLYKIRIAQSGKSEGQEVKSVVGYYRTIKSLLTAISREELLTHLSDDLSALNQRIEATIQQCVDTLGAKDELEAFIDFKVNEMRDSKLRAAQRVKDRKVKQ